MFLTISLQKHKWRHIVIILARVLVPLIIFVVLLFCLSYLGKGDPRLRDQMKEKPLRVEDFHPIKLDYNNS